MASDYDSNGGAAGLITFLFGITIGVMGTLTFAAVRRDQFEQWVARAQQVLGNGERSVDEYFHDANQRLTCVGREKTVLTS